MYRVWTGAHLGMSYQSFSIPAINSNFSQNANPHNYPTRSLPLTLLGLPFNRILSPTTPYWVLRTVALNGHHPCRSSMLCLSMQWHRDKSLGTRPPPAVPKELLGKIPCSWWRSSKVGFCTTFRWKGFFGKEDNDYHFGFLFHILLRLRMFVAPWSSAIGWHDRTRLTLQRKGLWTGEASNLWRFLFPDELVQWLDCSSMDLMTIPHPSCWFIWFWILGAPDVKPPKIESSFHHEKSWGLLFQGNPSGWWCFP